MPTFTGSGWNFVPGGGNFVPGASDLYDGDFINSLLSSAGVVLNFAANSGTQTGQSPGPATNFITTSRASTGMAVDTGGNWTTFAANQPRITNLGLTVEESRTNIVTQTQTMAVAPWQGVGAVVAAPTIIAGQSSPDGGTNAVRLVYPAVTVAPTSFSIFNTSAPATQANTTTYTASIFLKGAVGGEQIYLTATPDAATYSRQRVTLTTSWQRFQLQWTTTTGSYFFGIGTDLRDGSEAATPAQTVFAWQAQIEAGSFATTPIPTTSAAATRGADVVTLTTVPPIGASYTLQANGTPQSPITNAANQFMANVSDGTNTNRGSALRFLSTGSLGIAATGTGGTTANYAVNGQLNPGTTVVAQGALGKAALAQTGASGMTTVTIGARPDGGAQWNGTIAQVALWPTTALTAAQLQALTT